MHFSTVSSFSNWVSQIKQLSLGGRWQEVFSHYRELNKSGIQLTDPFYLHPILRACALSSLRHGMSIHGHVIKLGFESCTSTGNSVMDFYMKFGVLGSALRIFGCMKGAKDSVSWNILVRGYLDHGELDEGLWFFSQARMAGFEPNVSTLVLLIQTCRKHRALRSGLELRGYMIRSGFWALSSVQNSLLCLHADTGMENAQKLFDEISYRDVISWSVVIEGYVHSDEALVALGLFKEMVGKFEIEMDGQTMVSAVKACAKLGDNYVGRLFHGYVICKGFGNDLFIGNSLVDMYSKCSDIDSAWNVFYEISQKNVFSWNSLLSGLVYNELHSEARLLYDSMRKAGIKADGVTPVILLKICPFQCKSVLSMMIRQNNESNVLVINALIGAYAKCDHILHAWILFNQTKKKDTITWTSMIGAFTSCGLPDEAVAVFREMNLAQERPNAITMLNLLQACSDSAELKRSKWAHAIAIRRGLASEATVGTAILVMYSKCGEIETAKKAFHQIVEKNIISWSVMISAYGMNGLAHDALALFSEMKLHGLKPNVVTTLSVLSACSHGGLIEEGLSFFQQLVENQEVELSLEHYSCVVDLLSRGGKLDIAMDIIEGTAVGLKLGASAWGALLSACRNYRNRELGERAVAGIIKLEPSSSAGYLIGSSMYAADGSWVNAARMRGWLKERGLRVVAGHSVVHVDNKAFRFVAGGKQPGLLPDVVRLTVDELHKCMKIKETLNHAFF